MNPKDAIKEDLKKYWQKVKSLVKKEVDGIEVGGRNLYAGTKDFSGTNWMHLSSWSEDGVIDNFAVRKRSASYGVLCQELQVKAGETYTCSMYFKTDTLNNWSFAPDLSNSGLVYEYESVKGFGGEINKWYRIHKTITVTKDGTMRFGVERNGTGGTVWVCALKLEKGNKATDWTPAPEDMRLNSDSVSWDEVSDKPTSYPPAEHVHKEIDSLGQVAYYGSDDKSSNGWYRICSHTLTGYNDDSVRLSIINGYTGHKGGILDIHMRCNNAATLQCTGFTWETRYGFNENQAIINVDGNTWTLYIYRDCTQYGRMKVRILDAANTTDYKNTILLESNTVKESTTPIATLTASDGATVKRSREADYAKSSGSADKVNNHTVSSDVPVNAKFTDTTYSDATQTTHGLMSTTDKKKLDDISTGAEPNQPAYTYIDVDGGSGGTMGALEKEDTLNIKSGANVKVEVVTSGDGHDGNDGHSLKISAKDTTYGLFERGTTTKNPVNGLVPGPMYDMTDRAFLTVHGWEEFDLSAWCKADSVSIAQLWSDEYAELCQMPGATQEKAGVMIPSDKKKLDEIDIDTLKKELKAYIDQSAASFNIDKVYPVGSIYTSVNDTDPSNLFGGTWVRFGQGRTLVGVNSADDDFGKAERTGGEKTHTLNANEAPRHSHYITVDEKALTGKVWNFASQGKSNGPGNSTSGVFSAGGDANSYYPSSTATASGISDGFTLNATHTHTASSGVEGGGEAHNNMPPYITVYMWKRTK